MIMEMVTIEKAIEKDLPEILKIDKEVSLEYFVPFFAQHYSDYNFGKNPKGFLLPEIELDKKRFKEYINTESPHSLWVARNTHTNQILSLVIFIKTDATTIELELLMLTKASRGLGIGKRLVLEPLETFNSMKTCFLYCCKKNVAALKFYEKIGFTNTGPGPTDKLFANESKLSDTHYKLELNL